MDEWILLSDAGRAGRCDDRDRLRHDTAAG